MTTGFEIGLSRGLSYRTERGSPEQCGKRSMCLTVGPYVSLTPVFQRHGTLGISCIYNVDTFAL